MTLHCRCHSICTLTWSCWSVCTWCQPCCWKSLTWLPTSLTPVAGWSASSSITSSGWERDNHCWVRHMSTNNALWQHVKSREKEERITVALRLSCRTPREHERACGGSQQGHEDGRLAHMPLIHHQREDEQQGVGPVSWDAASAWDACQVTIFVILQLFVMFINQTCQVLKHFYIWCNKKKKLLLPVADLIHIVKICVIIWSLLSFTTSFICQFLNVFNRKIQEESLRTYLFTYSSVYDSIRWA